MFISFKNKFLLKLHAINMKNLHINKKSDYIIKDIAYACIKIINRNISNDYTNYNEPAKIPLYFFAS